MYPQLFNFSEIPGTLPDYGDFTPERQISPKIQSRPTFINRGLSEIDKKSRDVKPILLYNHSFLGDIISEIDPIFIEIEDDIEELTKPYLVFNKLNTTKHIQIESQVFIVLKNEKVFRGYVTKINHIDDKFQKVTCYIIF